MMAASLSRSNAPLRGLLIIVPTLLGWSYLFGHLFTLELPNAVAQAGPGMRIIAALQAFVSDNPLPIELNISLCLARGAQWDAADFTHAFAMWFAMTLAMMLPAAWRISSPRAAWPFAAFLTGYMTAWIPFCAVAVLWQWLLRSTGYLDEHLVSTSSVLNGSILLFLIVFYLLRNRAGARTTRSCERDSAGIIPGFRHGLRYGMHALKRCAAFMTIMFVVGLMNLIAMAVLTIAMIGLNPAASARPSILLKASRRITRLTCDGIRPLHSSHP